MLYHNSAYIQWCLHHRGIADLSLSLRDCPCPCWTGAIYRCIYAIVFQDGISLTRVHLEKYTLAPYADRYRTTDACTTNSSVATIFAPPPRKQFVWAPGQGVTATTSSWRAPSTPRAPRGCGACGAPGRLPRCWTPGVREMLPCQILLKVSRSGRHFSQLLITDLAHLERYYLSPVNSIY